MSEKGHFEKVCRSVSVNAMIPEEDSPNKKSIDENMTKDSTFDFKAMKSSFCIWAARDDPSWKPDVVSWSSSLAGSPTQPTKLQA